MKNIYSFKIVTVVSLVHILAKIVLLIAAISSSIKAFKDHATPGQTKTGILIAAVAYIGIVILAFTKPDNLF